MTLLHHPAVAAFVRRYNGPRPGPPVRRPPLGLAQFRVLHGIFEPGVFAQRFFSRATWEALPLAERPPHATYLPLFDAWQVLDLAIPWPAETPR